MQNAKILVVEDEVVVSTDIRIKLEKMGYIVPQIVRYGEKVIDAAREIKPDLILMDIQLKGPLNGVQAACNAKNELDIPVIFLTSYADMKTLNGAKESNPYGYMLKPVRLEDLRINLEVALYKASMDKRLKESEDKFRAIFNQAAVGVSLIETYTGRLLKVNKRYCDMLGYSEDELKTISFKDFTHPDDMQFDFEKMRKLKNGEINEFSIEKRYLRKDGTSVWVDLTVSPLKYVDGEILEHVAIVQDISDRKKIELEREHLIGELKEALAQVKELSGILPICSFCKRIRDDQGYWNMIEKYITERSEVQFSHSICQECKNKHYPEFQ